jgi:hypothetical protein
LRASAIFLGSNAFSDAFSDIIYSTSSSFILMI